MIKTEIRGIPLWVHDSEDLSNHIRRESDFFEAEILDYIRNSFPVHHTILDIGANIGNHSVYFANYLTYENILCFEPISENYELLVKNLEPYDNIGIFKGAVSDKTRKVKISPFWPNMGASEIRTDGEREIGALALDRIGLQNVTLMKIDVERHEPQVLDGAQDTIYRCKPLILIEDSDNEYAKLLPDYELIQGWPHHKTYLYGWRV